MVVTSPARIVGRIMNDAFSLPEAIIIPITVVGISWTPELAKTIVIIIGKVIVPLLSSISSMAFIPRGIDAPPIPSTLVESESERYFFAFLFIEFFPQSLSISGDKRRDRKELSFVFSTIPKIPSQTAYIASSSNESDSALFVAPIIVGRTLLGLVNIRKTQDKRHITTQILFIVKFIV